MDSPTSKQKGVVMFLVVLLVKNAELAGVF